MTPYMTWISKYVYNGEKALRQLDLFLYMGRKLALWSAKSDNNAYRIATM